MDYQQKNYQYTQPYATPGQERQVYVNQPCPKPTPYPAPGFDQPVYQNGSYSSPYGPLSGFIEESYIENILRLNKGKVGTFYFTYTDSNEWRDRVYKGVIEAAGRDHLIISDPKTGKRYLLQMIYFTWAEFDEEIAYDYPFR